MSVTAGGIATICIVAACAALFSRATALETVALQRAQRPELRRVRGGQDDDLGALKAEAFASFINEIHLTGITAARQLREKPGTAPAGLAALIEIGIQSDRLGFEGLVLPR